MPESAAPVSTQGAAQQYDLRAVAAWVSGRDPHIPERILMAAGARQWAYTLAELRIRGP